MANKKIDKDRIIELTLKQPKQDQLYIVNGIVKGLSEDNANAKLENENKQMKLELKLYNQSFPKFVKEHIDDLLEKENKKLKEKEQENQ